MRFRWQLIALLAALLLVEMAAYFKLSAWLLWTNEPLLAYTSALAFVGLLMASIVALGQDIPPSMRGQFYLGGLLLFACQAIANVLIAYEHSFALMPVDVVTSFFGINAGVALKAMAAIQGGTLSLVSVSFWSLLGELLRRQRQERQQQRAQLQKLEEFLEEVAK